MRKPKPPAPAPKNTRALARRLFPDFTRRKQAEWVMSKLRVMSGVWAYPVGRQAKPGNIDNAPEFLRRLPPGPPLEIKTDRVDKVRGAVRYLKNFAK